MKSVLLTGGTGFVGANLARRLLREGHVVHLLVRAGHHAGRIEDIRRDVQLHQTDLADAASVSAAMASVRPDWIFHLAAHGAYSWQNNAAEIVQTNLMGTINLVEAGLKTGFAAFVHTGSSSEYGFKDHAPVENDWLEPNSTYAITKASATMYGRFIARSRKVNITTLRLFSAYGPYEETNRLMPTLIRHGLKGELPPLVNPDTARDFVYVDDVCDACVRAAQTPAREFGAVYNVGTGVQTRMREVVEVARRLMRITVEPRWDSMPARTWDTSVWVADITKIQAELGWKPQFTFAQGFQQMIRWQEQSAT